MRNGDHLMKKSRQELVSARNQTTRYGNGIYKINFVNIDHKHLVFHKTFTIALNILVISYFCQSFTIIFTLIFCLKMSTI